jgi:hypothetical protein
VEAHIIVSNYRFPYLVLGSGPTQSTITLLKESSKAGKGRSVAAESLGFIPFELFFGHSMGGPLKILKDKFVKILLLIF